MSVCWLFQYLVKPSCFVAVHAVGNLAYLAFVVIEIQPHLIAMSVCWLFQYLVKPSCFVAVHAVGNVDLLD